MIPEQFDTVVVGATPAGIAAAVTLARLGRTVALTEYHPLLGGMMTGGIGKSDIENREAIGGVFSEFVQRVLDHYLRVYGRDSSQAEQCRGGYYYEPSVAAAVLEDMIREHGRIRLFLRHRLERAHTRDGRVERIDVLDRAGGKARAFAAPIFIDATYEGDLFAGAGAGYRLGRESRDEFGEPHAGRIYLDHETHEMLPGSTGEGDHRLPAYTYRLCLTTDPANSYVLDREPDGYDRSLYLPYLEDLAKGRLGPPSQWVDGRGYFSPHFDTVVRALSMAELPNGKMDANINPRALAFPFAGENDDYPEADWDRREQIARRHRQITLGLIYFLQNDPSVPPPQRELARKYHLPKDEFEDNGHLPYQLYIREARRLRGRYVLTEHDVTSTGEGRTPIHVDSIACGEFPIDSFPVRKKEPGHDRVLEGYLCMVDEVTRPYQIPYRIMLPETAQGLIVPVAASATHVAFSTIRMEPTWMAMGQAAGAAAHLCLMMNRQPAELSCAALQRLLLRQRQVITYFDDVPQRHPAWKAIQFWGARGFFDAYVARPDDRLDPEDAAVWLQKIAGMDASPLESRTTGAARSLAVAAATGRAAAPSSDRPRESFGELLSTLAPQASDPSAVPDHGRLLDEIRCGAIGRMSRGDFCRALYDLFDTCAI